MNRGYVKLHRKTLDSPAWDLPPEKFKVWSACLILANYKDEKWFDGAEEIVIPRGSFVTSTPKLAQITRLGRQAVRGSLATLSKMRQLATKVATNRYTMITVVNYGIYQSAAPEATKAPTKVATKKQPTSNHKQEVKEVKTIPNPSEPQNGSAHQEIIDHYHRLFEAKFRTTPLIVGGRDGKIVKDLLKARNGAAEIKGLLDLFFQVGTKYARENGKYDLPAFKASYNELLILHSRRGK